MVLCPLFDRRRTNRGSRSAAFAGGPPDTGAAAHGARVHACAQSPVGFSRRPAPRVPAAGRVAGQRPPAPCFHLQLLAAAPARSAGLPAAAAGATPGHAAPQGEPRGFGGDCSHAVEG